MRSFETECELIFALCFLPVDSNSLIRREDEKLLYRCLNRKRAGKTKGSLHFTYTWAIMV